MPAKFPILGILTQQMPVTSLDQLDLSRTYTYEAYASWQVEERIELLEGHIHLMSPAPNLQHQRVSGNLFLILGTYCKHRPCELFAAPFDVRLPAPGSAPDSPVSTVVQPDLCVVCDPAKLDEHGCIGAPDLVIEILSPGNSRKELREKYRIYESSGVREYWVVSPHERYLSRFVRDAQGTFAGMAPLTDEDLLETSLFPELSVPMREVFGE
ncbi:MAG: Uma2 family endonuclease [Bacteroidia bacterium]|nr:Uma2 family endonuclease [Bacteroidia bacterium]